jgi:UDP-N-acetylglucosamine 2-epimerase (non-hydrolysing)
MNRRNARRSTPRELGSVGQGAKYRVCVILGTRPEAIKLAPVIHELQQHRKSIETIVITTTQHRDLLAQALDAFNIKPNVDLGLPSIPQALADFTARALLAMSSTFAELRPDLVLLQGDTTTVLCAALAAHYLGIPVAHVEAGLRTGNIRNPFPDELNRRLATVVADLHFAPTDRARNNLKREGVAEEKIVVTGNTIVDAVRFFPRKASFNEPRLNALPWEKRRFILATIHRRETLGEALLNVCQAIAELAAIHTDVQFVIPVHPNPRVRDVVINELMGMPRVELVEPVGYSDMVELMRRSLFVMTDSGSVQEECPVLGKPVLILRKSTERPEVVESGFGRLVGTETLSLVDAASLLLDDPRVIDRMTEGENPFGDGTAAQRIVQTLMQRAPTRAGGSPIPEGPAMIPTHHAVER